MTIQMEWSHNYRQCIVTGPSEILLGQPFMYNSGDVAPRYPLPVTEDVSCAYHLYLWYVFTVEWNGTD